MKAQCVAMSAVFLAASSVLADAPLMPVSEIPVPPARAAAFTPAVAPSGGKVVVLPFEVLSDAGGRDWVGRAVRDSLASDIARLNGFTPVSVAAPAPVDTSAALAAAAKSQGDVVIFGDCQFDGTDVRLTGQVVLAGKGEALAGLKASGNFRDFFEMEDQLSNQVSRALRPPAPAVAGSGPKVDDSMIFGKEAPVLSTADLYQTPSDAERFAGDYNHYYYAPAYEPFIFGYGDPFPFEGGYSLFGTGFYPVEISSFGPNRGGGFHHRDGGFNPPPSQPRSGGGSGGGMRGH